MKLKVVQTREGPAEVNRLYGPVTRVLDAETGRPLENVKSAKVVVNEYGTLLTLEVVDVDVVSVPDETSEEKVRRVFEALDAELCRNLAGKTGGAVVTLHGCVRAGRCPVADDPHFLTSGRRGVWCVLEPRRWAGFERAAANIERANAPIYERARAAGPDNVEELYCIPDLGAAADTDERLTDAEWASVLAAFTTKYPPPVAPTA